MVDESAFAYCNCASLRNTKLILSWMEEKISLNWPATKKVIADTEEKIDFRFPDDFKAFYQKIDGFKDWVMDEEMLSLWPLEKIVVEHDQSNFIGFCDFCINCHVIGFLKNKKGIYKNYGMDELIWLSHTFSQFLEQWQHKTGEYY